jgi:1-phosphofructokinase
MIYTVTCNPSLDYVLEGQPVLLGKVNRSQTARMVFGGKGINQSVIFTRLGVPNRALGFAGGYAGRQLRKLLEKEGIREELTEIQGETRINIKLRAGEETEINAPGPLISPQELRQLSRRLETLEEGDVLSFGGSLPPGIEPDFVREILDRLRGRGVFTVADADGELLRRSLEGRPTLVKPNRDEAARLLEMVESHPDFARAAARGIQAMGARNVLLSLGADGAALLTESGEFYQLAAPQGVCKGATGAGDSLAAGFLTGLAWGRSWSGALALAVAAGSAAAFAGRLAEKEEILSLAAQIKRREGAGK